MKKNTLIIIIVVLILQNCFILIYSNKLLNQSDQKSNYNPWFIGKLDEGKQVKRDIKFFDSSGNEFYLADIVKSNPKLIFKISKDMCLSCIDEIIIDLQDYMDRNNCNEKLILVCSGFTNKEFLAFSESRHLNFKTYNILDYDLGFNLEKSPLPFLFIADTSCTSRMVFAVDIDNANYLKLYLEIVMDDFLS